MKIGMGDYNPFQSSITYTHNNKSVTFTFFNNQVLVKQSDIVNLIASGSKKSVSKILKLETVNQYTGSKSSGYWLNLEEILKSEVIQNSIKIVEFLARSQQEYISKLQDLNLEGNSMKDKDKNITEEDIIEVGGNDNNHETIYIDGADSISSAVLDDVQVQLTLPADAVKALTEIKAVYGLKEISIEEMVIGLVNTGYMTMIGLINQEQANFQNVREQTKTTILAMLNRKPAEKEEESKEEPAEK